MNLLKPTSVPPSGGIAAGAMRSRSALVRIAILAFLALPVLLLSRTTSAQTGTAKIWDITSTIGFNPDATVADTAGATLDVATTANPLTIVSSIDNTTHFEGPCGLIYMNPATNAFEWWGVGFGVTAGLDLDRSGPTITGPPSLLLGPVTYQKGDVWVTISGSPPLYVKLKGTPHFRAFGLADAAQGIRVNQGTGDIVFVNAAAQFNLLHPASGLLKTWMIGGGGASYVGLDAAGNAYGTFHGASTAGGADAVVRLNPVTNVVTSWPLPPGSIPAPFTKGNTENGVTVDAGGDVWFSESGTNKIGRLTLSTNTLREYSKPGIMNPQQIATSGSGSSLQAFFTEDDGNSVTVIDASAASPTTSTVTPKSTTITPATSTPPVTDTIRTPLKAVITPTTFMVPGVDPTGITRFSPMPTPAGGSSAFPNSPSGMTEVALPNTVFGTYIAEPTGQTNNAMFQFSCPCITAPPPPPPGDPLITATGTTFSATEGTSFSGKVASFHDPDTSATAAEYSATIDWGDGTSSAGTISGSGGSFDVNGTHTYAEQGSYTVKVTITDVDNPANSATAMSTARVGDAALRSMCAMPPVTAQAYTGPTATFNDSSSTGTLSDFSATIDWGDSTTTAGTIAGGPGLAPYTVSGSHTYTSTGPFTVTTTITDNGGSRTTATCQVLVFAFPTATGSFVIGDLADPLPIVGDSVTWWSSQWAQLNPMSGGPAPASMKGFAGFEDNPLGTPRTCGSSWTTDTGNATPPPPSVPLFMGVLVSSTITQNGSVITGNIKQVVVVHNNPGYAPDPGHTGTGTIVGIVCVSP
jgi:hypothetical protein